VKWDYLFAQLDDVIKEARQGNLRLRDCRECGGAVDPGRCQKCHRTRDLCGPPAKAGEPRCVFAPMFLCPICLKQGKKSPGTPRDRADRLRKEYPEWPAKDPLPEAVLHLELMIALRPLLDAFFGFRRDGVGVPEPTYADMAPFCQMGKIPIDGPDASFLWSLFQSMHSGAHQGIALRPKPKGKT